MKGEKKTQSEMIGEFMRDAGILFFVFAPLDLLFSDKAPGWAVYFFLLCSMVFFFMGMAIERWRE